MAHAAIQPSDQDHYYSGDAIDIPFQFKEQHNDTAIDLTGMDVEFRLKENLTDPDTDAVLVKDSTQTDADGNPEIEITDAANGTAVVHILTDDTAGTTTDDSGNRIESVVMMWHVRVIDGNGRRVTSETGEWTIHAS